MVHANNPNPYSYAKGAFMCCSTVRYVGVSTSFLGKQVALAKQNV